MYGAKTMIRPGLWFSKLADDKRSCWLLGYYCVADFDISIESLAPLAPELLRQLDAHEKAILDPSSTWATLNIGLYAGGSDIRVWRVWSA